MLLVHWTYGGTGLGDVADGAWAVKLGGDDVVHHTAKSESAKCPCNIRKKDVPPRVTNPKASRLDTTNGGRTNNKDTLLLGHPQNLMSMRLRDTLSNQSNRTDLWELEALKGARVHRMRRGEVNNNISIGVLGASLLEARADGEERLLGAPVELSDVVASKG